MVIKIKSKVFEDGEPIPTKYTCSGVDVSPPLEWTSIPEDTESIGIICEVSRCSGRYMESLDYIQFTR